MSNIKHYREKQGLTQGQLAVSLNVTQSAVAKWETGDAAPRSEKLIKLSRLFGCSIDDLLNNNKHHTS